jgi:hypothetical protein
MTTIVNPKLTAAARTLTAAALMLAGVCATGTGAAAQDLRAPATPVLITPPVGNSAFAIGNATGTQGYTCLPVTPGANTVSWTAKGARPEATLFHTVFGFPLQIVTHFLSPDTNPNDAAPKPLPAGSATWQSSLDSSKVWAAVLHNNSIPAGSDATCPNTGSIACLLLESIGSDAGPTGGTLLSRTTFVQRLNTNGGSAPAQGCSTLNDVGNLALVPYTADYVFFRKD